MSNNIGSHSMYSTSSLNKVIMYNNRKVVTICEQSKSLLGCEYTKSQLNHYA